MSAELHFAIDEEMHQRLTALLLRNQPEEEVCFALISASTGNTRRTPRTTRCREPAPGEREVHGNVSFSAPFVDRAIDAAIDAGTGLALVHSHPFGVGFQRPSIDDRRAEARTADTAAFALPGKPIAGIILSGDGTLSGREYSFTSPGAAPTIQENDATRVVGRHLVMQRRGQALAPLADVHRSQVGLFGRMGQPVLAGLKVGVVGVGSVGGWVALQLARMGVGVVGGTDYDHVEARNLNRLPAFPDDVGLRKVLVSAREAKRAATASAFKFLPLVASIVEEDGARAARDFDVLFSCADSHWSRQVLNAISYAHLIPVIDGGTAIRSAAGAFQTASFRTQVTGPGRGCLECGRGFDPAAIGEEMAGIVAPHYAPDDPRLVGEPSVIALNSALASFEVMRFMELVLRIADERELPAQRFDYRGGDVQLEPVECRSTCVWAKTTGLGDGAVLPLGVDPRFERARAA